MTALQCAECAVVVTHTGKHRAYSCAGCSETLCELHTVYYVDGNNRAINNGPAWCDGCYADRYGRRVSEVFDPEALA